MLTWLSDQSNPKTLTATVYKNNGYLNDFKSHKFYIRYLKFEGNKGGVCDILEEIKPLEEESTIFFDIRCDKCMYYKESDGLERMIGKGATKTIHYLHVLVNDEEEIEKIPVKEQQWSCRDKEADEKIVYWYRVLI